MHTVIKLGSRVKDSVTGLIGTATARAEYLHGSPRVQVEATITEPSKPIESAWFDESRLSEVE